MYLLYKRNCEDLLKLQYWSVTFITQSQMGIFNMNFPHLSPFRSCLVFKRLQSGPFQNAEPRGSGKSPHTLGRSTDRCLLVSSCKPLVLSYTFTNIYIYINKTWPKSSCITIGANRCCFSILCIGSLLQIVVAHAMEFHVRSSRARSTVCPYSICWVHSIFQSK